MTNVRLPYPVAGNAANPWQGSASANLTPPLYTFYTSVGIRSDTEAWQWLEEASNRATPPNTLPQYDAEALLDKLQAVYPHGVFTLSTPEYSLRREPKESP